MVFGKDAPQPGIFSEILNQEMAPSIFVNAGVNGYSTWQELLVLKKWMARIAPQTVILFYTQANDLDWNVRRDSFHPGVEIREGELVSWPVNPKNQISFYKRLESYRLMDHAFLHGADLHYYFHRFDFYLRGERSWDWTVARKIFAEFSRLKIEKGFSLIVIDIPTHRQLENSWPSRLHRSLLKEASLAEGFSYLDLGEHYPSDYKNIFLPDRHHWNEKGHRLIADLIKKSLPKQP
jgi:hypothetical protein